VNAERLASTIYRAYSTLTVKAANDDERIIEGVATTPTPDSYEDIVDPKGAEFVLPLPLLWQHNSREPVGHVTKAKVTNEGISVVAKFTKITEPGKLKDRLDEAWQSVKAGLVRGLSIGFRAKEYTFIENTGGIHFLKWAWLELSPVTIPANSDAGITEIRSIDRELRKAASGQPHLGRAIRLLQPKTRVGNIHRAATGAVKLIR
jgi:HK97 family phage prohead protease